MAKGNGGTRNYSGNSATLGRRLNEFESLMGTGEYDPSRSAFDKSGGFYITHKDHDRIKDHQLDKSDEASKTLAKKGYKVYLDSEKSYIEYDKKPDGRIYRSVMDIKTINSAGTRTVFNGVKEAERQVLRWLSFSRIQMP